MNQTCTNPINIPLFCTLPFFDASDENSGWNLIEKLQEEPLSCKEALLSEDLTRFLSAAAKEKIGLYPKEKSSPSIAEDLLAIFNYLEGNDKEIALKGLINLYRKSSPSLQKTIEQKLQKEYAFCTVYVDTLIWEIQSLEGWKMTYLESPDHQNSFSEQIEKIVTLIQDHLEILFPSASPNAQRKIVAYKR